MSPSPLRRVCQLGDLAASSRGQGALTGKSSLAGALSEGLGDDGFDDRQLVELLDPKTGPVQERAKQQLLALERTVSKQGKDAIGHGRGGVDDVINAVAGACLLARKTQSEAGKVVAMPKRQAVSPRTLSRLRPQGRVERLTMTTRDPWYASLGWVSARGRFA
jgi:hypothetical protein